jgi:hypothetical protein
METATKATTSPAREPWDGQDPLHTSAEVLEEAKSSNIDPNSLSEDLYSTLTECVTIDSAAQQNMDPLEWTFRKLYPIPQHYYWEVVTPDQLSQVPLKIKIWHRTTSMLWSTYQVVDRYVAQPIARETGITKSRFDYVIDTMTQEDWESSKQMIAERDGKSRDNVDTVSIMELQT